MDTGHGEQKCACNLHQEESGSDFYRGCAENISGSRKDVSRSSQSSRSLLDFGGKTQPASPCTKRASFHICENVLELLLLAVL